MRATVHAKSLTTLPAPPPPWAMLGAAVICAAVFVAVTAFVFEGAHHVAPAAAAFDRSIAQFLQQFRAPALTGRVMEVSALGSAPVLAMLALLAYAVILKARDRIGFLHLSTVVLGASVLSRLLQHLFDRERPDSLLSFVVVTKGSFPSAHLFGAAACYATFSFFYARYAGGRGTAAAAHVLAATVVLCIGATRVYLGAHHATDVIAGIAAGWAWALLAAAAFAAWYRQSRGKP